MKKIHYTIYINDNILFLLENRNNKIISQEFKSLQEDQIINIQEFCNEFSFFLTKNHIHIPLFGWNLCFIKTKFINEVMLEKYIEIFKDYFQKIITKNIEDVLKIDTETGYLNINNQYIDYYFMKKNKQNVIRIHNLIFNENITKIINHCFTNFYKPNKLVLFGNNSNIPTMVKKIYKNYNINTTFSEFHQNYILEKYKK